MILAMPGRLPAGVTVSNQVRLYDAAPTILESLGLWEKRAQLPSGNLQQGQSLVPLMQGEKEMCIRDSMARACGPAELGREVLVRLSTTSLTADVLSQQKANGMVQIEAGMPVRQVPAFLIASPTSPFDTQLQAA